MLELRMDGRASAAAAARVVVGLYREVLGSASLSVSPSPRHPFAESLASRRRPSSPMVGSRRIVRQPTEAIGRYTRQTFHRPGIPRIPLGILGIPGIPRISPCGRRLAMTLTLQRVERRAENPWNLWNPRNTWNLWSVY